MRSKHSTGRALEEEEGHTGRTDCSNEFDEWLLRMCEINCTSFYRRSSEKGRNSRLLCNRCGEGTTRESKVHLHCSAFANVHFKEDGTVSATGCFEHIGHEPDPALVRWADEQVEYLKYMIQGFSTDYIIQEMRRDYESKECRLASKKHHRSLWKSTQSRISWGRKNRAVGSIPSKMCCGEHFYVYGKMAHTTEAIEA
ncbi:unnamed protein product [Haemonchus placei]|uniref:PHD-type domain-containing protein n=1 Tax=Haemonchus placei TaxID=6290 RepID=A0A0N4X185_HAEPC|nr:unnamed protein product [Haemonchus placei]